MDPRCLKARSSTSEAWMVLARGIDLCIEEEDFSELEVSDGQPTCVSKWDGNDLKTARYQYRLGDQRSD